MDLRRAVPVDAEAVLALWKAAETTASVTDTAEQIRQVSTRNHVAFVLATVDDDIVGSIIATFDGWRGNMYRLVTHPGFRRKGVATALVREAEAAFDEWGVKRITALVEAEHTWAVHFWRSVGYSTDERMARYVRNL